MKCQYCKKSFEPDIQGQACCSYVCALNYSRGKIKKEKKIKDKEVKERLKTKSQYLKELQLIFNKYIRLRDKDKPCISCSGWFENKDAGHYFSVGSTPALRYHELNCWGQCRHCNSYLSGNLINYREGLILRIGQKKYDELYAMQGQRLQLSIPEIEDLKKVYKQKIKDLDN